MKITRMVQIMTLNCTLYVDYWNGYYLKFQCGMHNLDSPVLLIIHHHFDVDDICFCFECVHIICSYAWRSWAFESFIRHVWIMYGLDQQHVMIILYLNLINNKNRNQTTEIVLCNEIFFEYTHRLRWMIWYSDVEDNKLLKYSECVQWYLCANWKTICTLYVESCCLCNRFSNQL